MSSYKLRKVPKNWEHPKDKAGNYIPLYDGSYTEYSNEYDEEKEMWNKGLQKQWNVTEKDLSYVWVSKKDEDKNMSFEEWHGEKKLSEAYVPDWQKNQLTHFQMYEDVTEGVPVSPIFKKIKNLANWLANNLNDSRYPYTSIEWLQILKSSDP